MVPNQGTTSRYQIMVALSKMPPRNVHFLDGTKNEITGFFQNGSVTWYEFSEWMHLFFANPVSDYAIFPSGCLEQHEPQDPVALHGPAISLSDSLSIPAIIITLSFLSMLSLALINRTN